VKGTSEDKRARFVRLAESRVNSALRTLRLIGNLSNRGNYTYTEKDVAKIFNTLERELKNARARFESGGSGSGPHFKLE